MSNFNYFISINHLILGLILWNSCKRNVDFENCEKKVKCKTLLVQKYNLHEILVELTNNEC